MSLQDLIDSSNIPLIKEYFVKNPGDINKVYDADTYCPKRPLIIFLISLCKFEIIELLLTSYALNPNITYNNYSPLIYLIVFTTHGVLREKKIAKLLLNHGADPNFRYCGNAAIFYAEGYCGFDSSVLQLLLEYDGWSNNSSNKMVRKIKLLNIKN